MQVMPDTGRWIASQVGLVDFDDNMLFDPEVNIMLGVWYISSLMKEFNSELPLALAAYNAGKGNVSVWLREGRWSGKAEDIDSIPFPETRGYIERVIKTHWWYSLLYKSRFRLWKIQS